MTAVDVIFIVLASLIFLITFLYALGFVFFNAVISRQKKEQEGPNPLTERLMGAGNSAKMAVINQGFAKQIKELPTEEVRVTTVDGLTLVGHFIPSEGATTTVLLNHGYRSHAYKEMSPMAYFYHKHGCNVLLVNHRAHGDSEGRYIGFGVLDSTDAVKWLTWLKERVPEGAIFIHGTSMGGATTVMSLKNDLAAYNVKGLISDCAFTSPHEEFAFQCKSFIRFTPRLLLFFASFFCRRTAGYNFKKLNGRELVRAARVPMLFIHGEDDVFIPIEMSRAMYDNCAAEKQFYPVAGAGHSGSYMLDPEGYERVCVDFIEKYSRV